MQNYNVERRSNIPLGEEIETQSPLSDIDVEIIDDVLGSEDEPGTVTPPSMNIAERMDDGDLEAMSSDLVSMIDADYNSLEDWRRLIKDGLEILGLGNEPKDQTFEGASTVTHPLLLESVVKYQAKARTQILPPDGPVKCRVVGSSTEELREAARRKAKYMNLLVQETMYEYEPEHDRMLFYQGFLGSGITKTYWDDKLGRPSSRNVSAHNFVVDYYASDFESAERLTEIFTINNNELVRRQETGLYLDKPLRAGQDTRFNDLADGIDKLIGRSRPYSVDADMHTMLECHIRLALDPENPIYDPEVTPPERNYIVVIHSDSGKIVAIYLNESEAGEKNNYYTHWPFIPGFGIFGFGYLHLIGGLSETSTKVLRQLLNAGVFSNFPAGFKAHGIRVTGSSDPLMPGEWREVNTLGQDLQRALVPLPYKEPSATLAKLLEFIVGAGQRFADSVEEIVNNAKNYGPVNTTLALMEASGQLFNGIHERLFRSQKNEFKILHKLVKDYGPEMYPFSVAPAQPDIIKQDFMRDIDVIPSANPKMPSEAHRLTRAMSHFQIASQSPDHHNMPAVLVEMHRALGEEQPERFVKMPAKPSPPLDPVTENSLILSGQGVKAYPGQAHEAHLLLHIHGVMNNPLYAQNKMVVAMLESHIQEHLGLKFKADIERAIGQPIPEVDPSQPEAMEMQNAIARMAAQRIEEVVRMNTMEAMDMLRTQVTLDPALEIELKKIEKDNRKIDIDQMRAITQAMNDMMQHRAVERREWESLRIDERLEEEWIDVEREKIAATAARPRGGDSGN